MASTELERLKCTSSIIREAACAITAYGVEVHNVEPDEGVTSERYQEAEQILGNLCESDQARAWKLGLAELGQVLVDPRGIL